MVRPSVRPARGLRLLAVVTAATMAAALAAGCARETVIAEPPAPQPAPSPVPTPSPTTPAPTEDADDVDLPDAVAATRDALLAAALAEDWDALALLLPTDGAFTASFGAEDDPIAYYRSLPRPMLPDLVTILEAPAAELEGLYVWPDLHARIPFAVSDDERGQLEARYGADFVSAWEQQGSYTGWRVGIEPDGTWRFLVAGD